MKRPVVVSFAVCLLFVLLALPFRAGTEEAAVNYNNVLIILDASGSMDGALRGTSVRRMDAAKDALKQALKHVPMDTQIGLLVFSGRNIRNDLVYPLGPRDDDRLMNAITLPQPGGGTPLGAYIKKGADILLQQRAKQRGYGTYRLLIVTDGEAGDKPLVERYVPEVIARGITVDVIGVDMATTHTLATKVHSYRSADDPESLTRAISEVFAEVSQAGVGDTAGEEAFAMLDPIPSEMADAMLKALSSSGNEPVGEKHAMDESVPVASAPPTRMRPKPSSQVNPGGMLKAFFLLIVAIAVVMARVRKRR